MRILVIGSGAREHAITWKFSRSKRISGLFVAPGNAGTDEIATNLPQLQPDDAQGIADFCRENRIDLAFIGPEKPLVDGLADVLNDSGIPTIGPGREAAQLEGSKAFAKKFMSQYGIPTAEAREFSDFTELEQYLGQVGKRVVLKKSGLAAGKGVLESSDRQEMLSFGRQVLKDDLLVVEEHLGGYEISVFALSDGKNWVLLPPCADYKKSKEGAVGLNTGGLGSVCPVPWLDTSVMDRVRSEVVVPTFEGLRDRGLTYKGVVYFGLMITDTGPKLLEYNVRMGDPETQVLLPLIRSDFGNLCGAMIDETLADFPLSVSEKSALGVVVASPGYPGDYPKNLEVTEIPALVDSSGFVFHANTKRDDAGVLRTGGGRSFTAVGLGSELLKARTEAYSVAQQIRFPGAWFRSDIGARIFGG